MSERELIQTTLRRLSRRLRFVRAATAGTRFAVAGLVLALVPLLLKDLLPAGWPWIAAGCVLGLAAAGLVYGTLLRVLPDHAARLAHRHLGLKERMTASLEHLSTAEASDMVRACCSTRFRRD